MSSWPAHHQRCDICCPTVLRWPKRRGWDDAGLDVSHENHSDFYATPIGELTWVNHEKPGVDMIVSWRPGFHPSSQRGFIKNKESININQLIRTTSHASENGGYHGIPPIFGHLKKKENHDKQLDFGIPDNPDNIFSQKSNAKGIKLIGPLYVPHFSGSNLAARALNGLGIPTIRQDKPTKTPCLSCLIPPKFCRLGIGVSIIYIYIYTHFFCIRMYTYIYIYT